MGRETEVERKPAVFSNTISTAFYGKHAFLSDFYINRTIQYETPTTYPPIIALLIIEVAKLL